MYKLNNGKGAIICDKCKTTIKENIPEPKTLRHLCDKCHYKLEELIFGRSLRWGMGDIFPKPPKLEGPEFPLDYWKNEDG